MEAVQAFARSGGPVIGICNGFQVLTEAGLLPGRVAEERRAALPLPAGDVSRSTSTSSVLTAGATRARSS